MDSKWSWVKGGLALGILNIIILLSGNHLGTTTAYAQTSGYFIEFFTSKLIPISTWIEGTCGTSGGLQVSWQWMLVLGIFIGGVIGRFIGRFIHGKAITEEIPKLWCERFGNRPKLRLVHAFIGGVLLLIGSRIAGGCTSSHIINGMSQMAVSGIIFAIAVFASGIPVSMLIYRRRDK